MTAKISRLFTKIKKNVANSHGISIEGAVDISELDSVNQRAAQICALDILLFEHRKKYGTPFNPLSGKRALHHKLLLKYKWTLSYIRTMSLEDTLLSLQDEIHFGLLPDPAKSYLTQITKDYYPVSFDHYHDAEWDPDLSEQFLADPEF